MTLAAAAVRHLIGLVQFRAKQCDFPGGQSNTGTGSLRALSYFILPIIPIDNLLSPK
jgi:hypothetical protein